MDDPLGPLGDLPGVRDAVASTRRAVDALLADRMLRRRSSEVSVESALRGAWASTQLSGVEIGLEAFRAGIEDPIALGALRAQAAIGPLAATWTAAPRQALARLHALAAADLVADDQLGRPAAMAAVRLDMLAQTLAATRGPAAVVAGVVYGELLALDAFAPVTGVVARAAVRLTLVERGLDPRSLVVVEVGLREHSDELDAALGGFAVGSADGLAQWLKVFASSIVDGAREAAAICTALARG
jgi:hypothetical protein